METSGRHLLVQDWPILITQHQHPFSGNPAIKLRTIQNGMLVAMGHEEFLADPSRQDFRSAPKQTAFRTLHHRLPPPNAIDHGFGVHAPPALRILEDSLELAQFLDR